MTQYTNCTIRKLIASRVVSNKKNLQARKLPQVAGNAMSNTITEKILGTHQVSDTQKKRNVVFTAIRSIAISIGIVSLSEAIEGNKGIQEILKSKFNLSLIGLFAAFDIGRAVMHNKEID